MKPKKPRPTGKKMVERRKWRKSRRMSPKDARRSVDIDAFVGFANCGANQRAKSAAFSAKEKNLPRNRNKK